MEDDAVFFASLFVRSFVGRPLLAMCRGRSVEQRVHCGGGARRRKEDPSAAFFRGDDDDGDDDENNGEVFASLSLSRSPTLEIHCRFSKLLRKSISFGFPQGSFDKCAQGDDRLQG